MIQRMETINIKLSPREVEKEIWGMDSLEQTDLILAMTQRYGNQTGDVLNQLYSVGEEFCNRLNDEERRRIIRFFNDVVEYLKEADREHREWENRGKQA